MKKLMWLLLAPTLALAAAPDYEMIFSRGKVVITSEPCTNKKVLDRVKKDYHTLFHAGVLVWDGDTLALCWAVNPNDKTRLFVIDKTGDNGELPLSGFKKRGTEI